MGHESALVDEGEEESEVPRILSVAHLPEEVGTAARLVDASSSALKLKLLYLEG
jgi:hypothetical protein